MIALQWLETAPYESILTLQEAVREKVISGLSAERILAVEHLPVVTLGKRDVDLNREKLEKEGIQVCKTSRGGLATYHGPGQLTFYPMVHLRRRRIAVRQFVCGLQTCLIRYLLDLGIKACSDERYPGVWVGRSKIAAIGLNVSRGVTCHGFSLNLSNSLQPYSLFTPCGIADRGVTSVMAIQQSSPSPRQAAEKLTDKLNEWLKNIDGEG